jgi:hypothetical protein
MLTFNIFLFEFLYLFIQIEVILNSHVQIEDLVFSNYYKTVDHGDFERVYIFLIHPV